MNDLLDWMYGLSPAEAAFWLLVENVALFWLALGAGHLADRLFAAPTGGALPDPLGRREVLYATSTVLLNWLITVAGWWLWRAGLIVIRRDTGWAAWLD